MNDYLNRVGRPAPTINRVGSEAPSHNGGKKFSMKNVSAIKVIFVLLLVSIAVLLASLAIYTGMFKGNETISSQIKPNQYQAVFLSSQDGQVYFGKLRELNKTYYILSDIYYVRVNQVQPDKNNTASTQSNISLAKLGNEIHGPEDVMYVAKDSVMFWENLKEDGQVVTAIRNYQKENAQPKADTTE